MGSTKTFIGGITVGAGLAYLLDPKHGRLRREQLARRFGFLVEEARRGLESDSFGEIEVGRYGSRAGDIEDPGAATLHFPAREGPPVARPTPSCGCSGASSPSMA